MDYTHNTALDNDSDYDIPYDLLTPAYDGFAEKHSEICPAERLAWLRLIRTENIGPVTFYYLLDHFGSAREALAQLPDFWAQKKKRKKIILPPLSQIEQEIEQLEKSSGRLVFACDPDYPALLKHIADPPPVLSAIGCIDLLNKFSVAIVGSRNASLNGCKIAELFAAQLGKADIATISGLARGIDTHAHKGSLQSGTIAVLGGGCGHIYPRENEKLYHQIAEQGLILSENPFRQVARAIDFPRRNRIVAGIAHAALIVEATPKSGSLITARLASEQGREVFAVPGSPLDARAKGTNELIRNGATLADSPQQIIDALKNYDLSNLADRPRTSSTPKQDLFTTATKAESEKITATESEETPNDAILSLLSNNPVDIDDIMVASGLAPHLFATRILELEIAGLVMRHEGHKISLS